MPETIAPARIDFVLTYACPQCGRETLLRATDVAGPLTCKQCSHTFQPQPLAEAARRAMLSSYVQHQPPVPRIIQVIGLRGYCYTLANSPDHIDFESVVDIDQLHGRLQKDAAAPPTSPVLIHGMIKEVSVPGDFAFAVLEGGGHQTEAFLEFADSTFDFGSLRPKSHICAQGLCLGLMGSHNPAAIVFQKCMLLGIQGRLLPPGGHVKNAMLDLPPQSDRNPFETHIIFQAPPEVESS